VKRPQPTVAYSAFRCTNLFVSGPVATTAPVLFGRCSGPDVGVLSGRQCIPIAP
jgi:hypothetical protein